MIPDTRDKTALAITPETLAAGYAFLRTTKPFRRLKMPPAEDVKFRVGRRRDVFGWYRWDGKRHTITVSAACVGHTITLLRIMAHEMVHLHLENLGKDGRGNENTHNAAFRKLAASVCRQHGFDLKEFF